MRTEATLDPQPLVSIITPIFRPKIDHLKACVQSVLDQTCGDWQLVLVDDGSNDPEVDQLLATYSGDTRIVVHRRETNGGIVAASNDGIQLASGRLLAFLDNDDLLEATAVGEVTDYAKRWPTAEVFYSDRGHLHEDGTPQGRTFEKPEWAPEWFRANMYLAHLTVVSSRAARDVGGLRAEFEGSQDHDLVLRIVERGNPVVHIPHVLYQWRASATSTLNNPDAKPHAIEAGLRAVTAHCARIGLECSPEHANGLPGSYVLNRMPSPGTKVSIVVPTCGSSGNVFNQNRCLVANAVESIAAHDYLADYEIIVVYDEDDLDHSYLDSVIAAGAGRVRLVPFAGSFNFSAKVNIGVLHATGDVVLLLNDDVQVISPNWLDHMAAVSQDRDVAAVGAKLLYDNNLVQHGGIVIQREPWWVFNADRGRVDDGGPARTLAGDHEVVAVTGAAMAVQTDIYFELGGFCEELPTDFNDIDFSFKALLRGYRNVVANSVKLYHFETMTRVPGLGAADLAVAGGRWRYLMAEDPYLRSNSLPIGHRSRLRAGLKGA